MGSSAWPRPAEAPALADMARCVRCGLCLNSCPTYVVTGLETESPRGRIFFARAIEEGDLLLTPAIQRHWELCLQCRACEAVCPSGVPFGRIMEHARAQLDAAAPEGERGRRLRRFLLRNVIGRPRVLRLAMAPTRWFASSWLRPVVRRAGLLRLFGPLGGFEAQLPPQPGRRFGAGSPLPAAPQAEQNAILFTGCVMAELFGDVHRATERVLARRGVRAVAPAGMRCCGALHAHDGDLDYARKLARANIDALEPRGEATIVVNSAGCGAAMKEYGDLLAEDERYRDRAIRFAARVRDATEYIASLPPVPSALEARVAYQDACHLAHAQGIREEPRSLLRHIAGAELVEGAGGDTCCGAAGIYSLVQPAMSAELRARKADLFRRLQPDIVTTANPGCQMQYLAAVREAGLDAKVLHVMEVLNLAESQASLTPP